MIDIRGKRVLVMGLGIHGGGLGVARFLAQQGATVIVTDLRGPDELGPSIAALGDLPIRYVLGEHREEDFRSADVVIRNPAVPRESRYLAIARAAGAAIEMEMTLFFRLCPGPILGVTGTKGKTTTTLLAGAMLQQIAADTVIAGNLRVSALEQLPRIGPHTPVALELSSWQLEGLSEARMSPRYACMTNILPDHLDRYGSFAAYAEAKEQIWRHQRPGDPIVLNAGDALTARMAAALGATRAGDVVYFAGPEEEAGAWRNGRCAYWRADQLLWRQGVQGDAELICDRGDVQLPGDHNLANIAAATALAKAFGVQTGHIRQAIRSFTGIPHRLEYVRELAGVRYINDTAATAPDAAIAALHSFDAPIVLIAGGADKQLPFAALAQAIVSRAKAVVLLAGTATSKLELALRGAGMAEQPARAAPLTIAGPFDDFAQAITAARKLAAPGDIVLLSPGCASFGMFRNEFHRGDEFRRIVDQIAKNSLEMA